MGPGGAAGVGEAEGKMEMCSGLFWWGVGVNVVF